MKILMFAIDIISELADHYFMFKDSFFCCIAKKVRTSEVEEAHHLGIQITHKFM